MSRKKIEIIEPELDFGYRTLQLIPVSQIRPNENNIREVKEDESLEALKESIKAVGLQQNLVVLDLGMNQYKLLSGHRRLKALQELCEEYPDVEDYKEVPCIIETLSDEGEGRVTPELEEKFKIVTTNLQIEQLTNKEILESINIFFDYFDALGESSVNEKSTMASKALKLSSRKIKYIRDFDSKLCKKLHQAYFENEDLQFMAAVELITLSPEEQEAFLKENSIKDYAVINQKMVQAFKERLKNGDPDQKPVIDPIKKRGPKPGTRQNAEEINFDKDMAELLAAHHIDCKTVSATKAEKYKKSLDIIKKQIAKIDKVLN